MQKQTEFVNSICMASDTTVFTARSISKVVCNYQMSRNESR